MRKTFKFRLYPSGVQRQVLEETLNTCRILYNSMLARRKESWEKEHRGLSVYEQKRQLPELKHSNPYLRRVHAQVLQDVVIRLDKAFKNFYRRARNGEKAGYPRFKGQYRYDSFTYPQSGFRIVVGKRLWLSKIGELSIKLHRELPSGAIIKTCTIRRDVDRWYACFSVELPDADAAPEEHRIESAVGVDVGLESLVTLSTGEKIEPPRFLRRSEEKLAWEQRRLSRKKKGSANRIKQRIRVAKLHRRIRDQRADFTHKLSRALVNSYDLIALEDLRIEDMLQNHHLAKSISDASWSQLQSFTAYKAEYAGKLVEFVVPNGTTQECSNCGATMQLGLADRTFRCNCCGFTTDRDHNAAINILKRVGWDAAESTPVETGVPLTREQPVAEAGSPRPL